MSGDIPSVGSTYLKYYKRQYGGGLSDITVYRRSRVRQEGDGIGDILRGIARFLLPLVFRGVQTFASETFRNTDKGMPFGSAAKSALNPTVNAVLSEASSRFQNGKGKKKKSRKSKKRSGKVFNAERTQTGSGKMSKKTHSRVYKGDSFGKRKQQTGSGKTKKRKQQVGKGKKKRAAKKSSKKSGKAELQSYNF